MEVSVENCFFEVGPGGRLLGPAQAETRQIVGGRLNSLRSITPTSVVDGRAVYDHVDLYDASCRLTEAYQDAIAPRHDANNATLGIHQPRDLVHEFNEALQERRPPLNATRLYPLSTVIPAGALEYRQYRMFASGEAVEYRGGDGSDVPAVGLANTWMNAPVIYYITKISDTWFKRLTDNFAGIDRRSMEMTGAIRALEEVQNRHVFQGRGGSWGALNHPYVDHMIDLSGAWLSADPNDITAAVIGWANYAEEQSGSTYQPNTCVMGVQLWNFLSQKRFGDGSDMTLLQHIQRSCTHITRWMKAREFNNAYGIGVHGMQFFRGGAGRSDRSLQIEQVMPITMLPPDIHALGQSTYLVSACGGLNQREVGDNLTVAVTL